MQSSSLMRNRSLNDVSKNVLRLINNKMCPLNQEKMNRIIKHRRKQKLTKVGTQPNQFASSQVTYKNTPINKSSFHEFEERTIGEHFYHFQTRELMSSKIQNKEYGLMTEKINDFIWARRQEIISNLSKKKDGKEKALQRQAGCQNKNQLRRNSSNLSHFLVKLRKKLKDQYQRQSEIYQTPILRYSEMQAHQKGPPSTIFFQDNYGIQKVMQRYPLRESQVRVEEDTRKKFQCQLMQDLNDNQENDKYTRMRINFNHRKIVSLK